MLLYLQYFTERSLDICPLKGIDTAFLNYYYLLLKAFLRREFNPQTRAGQTPRMQFYLIDIIEKKDGSRPLSANGAAGKYQTRSQQGNDANLGLDCGRKMHPSRDDVLEP